MRRIQLTDTMTDALLKLADGNPGALTVLTKLYWKEKEAWIHLLKLDDYGFYGPKIWLIYKDFLKGDIAKFFDLLKNNKLHEVIKAELRTNKDFRREWEWGDSSVTREKGSDETEEEGRVQKPEQRDSLSTGDSRRVEMDWIDDDSESLCQRGVDEINMQTMSKALILPGRR